MGGGGREPAGGPPADERAALAACRRGDRDAYELIVKRYAPRALGLARMILRDPALAEDVAQEAFVRAYRALKRFDLDQPFYPWFHRILNNVCLSAAKRRRSYVSLDAEQAPPVAAEGDGPPAAAMRAEARARVRRAIEGLSPPHREILYLAHFEGLAYKEIAACLRIPLGTVMSRLWAARRALRKVLAPLLEREDG